MPVKMSLLNWKRITVLGITDFSGRTDVLSSLQSCYLYPLVSKETLSCKENLNHFLFQSCLSEFSFKKEGMTTISFEAAVQLSKMLKQKRYRKEKHDRREKTAAETKGRQNIVTFCYFLLLSKRNTDCISLKDLSQSLWDITELKESRGRELTSWLRYLFMKMIPSIWSLSISIALTLYFSNDTHCSSFHKRIGLQG